MVYNKRLPLLYYELADWFPLLTAPEDYAEEADFYRRTILLAGASPVHTMLELGSGGGNNASHLKKHFQMTLVDLSSDMLKVSQRINPECVHIQGDMRTLRLERKFESVFIHDAIVYMTTPDELRQVFLTAFAHCQPGGVVLFAPDCTRETFKPNVSHGGHDGLQRSLRYLEWNFDPEPSDTTYLKVMVYLLRQGTEKVRCVQDQHICGLFSREDWLRWVDAAGFCVRAVPFVHSQIEPGNAEVFVGVRKD